MRTYVLKFQIAVDIHFLTGSNWKIVENIMGMSNDKLSVCDVQGVHKGIYANKMFCQWHCK